MIFTPVSVSVVIGLIASVSNVAAHPEGNSPDFGMRKCGTTDLDPSVLAFTEPALSSHIKMLKGLRKHKNADIDGANATAVVIPVYFHVIESDSGNQFYLNYSILFCTLDLD